MVSGGGSMVHYYHTLNTIKLLSNSHIYIYIYIYIPCINVLVNSYGASSPVNHMKQIQLDGIVSFHFIGCMLLQLNLQIGIIVQSENLYERQNHDQQVNSNI